MFSSFFCIPGRGWLLPTWSGWWKIHNWRLAGCIKEKWCDLEPSRKSCRLRSIGRFGYKSKNKFQDSGWIENIKKTTNTNGARAWQIRSKCMYHNRNRFLFCASDALWDGTGLGQPTNSNWLSIGKIHLMLRFWVDLKIVADHPLTGHWLLQS